MRAVLSVLIFKHVGSSIQSGAEAERRLAFSRQKREILDLAYFTPIVHIEKKNKLARLLKTVEQHPSGTADVKN